MRRSNRGDDEPPRPGLIPASVDLQAIGWRDDVDKRLDDKYGKH